MPNPPELGGAQSVDRDPKPGEQMLRDIAEGIAEEYKTRLQADKLRAIRDARGKAIVLESSVFNGAVRELLHAHIDDDHFEERVMSIIERVSLRIPQERNWNLELLGGIQALIAETEGSLAERTAETWQSQRGAKWLGKNVALFRPDDAETQPDNRPLHPQKAPVLVTRSGQEFNKIDMGLVVAGEVSGVSIHDGGQIHLTGAVCRDYSRNQATRRRVFMTEYAGGDLTIPQIFGEVKDGDNNTIDLLPKLAICQIQDLSEYSYPEL